MNLKLRDYQENLINKVRDAMREGYKRPLICLPCGGGKTVCFAYMALEHIKKNKNNYVYFLVHRRELISQTKETFNKFGIPTEQVYIGMVQSGSKLDKLPTPTLIIFDEAHHASSRTWTSIINKYPNVYIIGLTATPIRNDNRGLGNVFDVLIEGVDAEWLIENNYLSEFDYYAPRILNLKRGDFLHKGNNFDLKSVGQTMINHKIYGDIKKYLDLEKRKTIIYSPTIEFSQQLENDIPGVVHFDGNTPKKKRDEIIAKFRNGEIKCLTNIELIGEGFDVPDCDCVILLRPTESLALYIQQSMRCLRYREGKRAVIYDLVGNIFNFDFPTVKRKYTLDKNKRFKFKEDEILDLKIRQCKKCFRVYAGNNSICPYCNNDNGLTPQEIKIIEKAELEKIERLEKRKKAYEVHKADTLDKLIELGKQRGYKNPYGWARNVMRNRYKRI